MSDYINNIFKNLSNRNAATSTTTATKVSSFVSNKKDIMYYNTYLIIGFIIAFYSLAFFYSLKENSELICLIIFLIFNIFLLLFMGQTFYKITYNEYNLNNIFQMNNIYYKILWLFLWSTIPISLILVIASNITMISVFDGLFGTYVVKNNANSIPLSQRYRIEFQRYKLMLMTVFFLSIMLFCYLLNNWLPTENFGNVIVIFKIISVIITGLALLGIPGYMLYMGDDFIFLRNRKLLFNN